MEVKSVANVVIQKLTDMLNDEKSITGKKAIVDQLTEIKNDLEKLSGLFTDAESKKGSEATKFAADYLEFLYYVEDAIETFALRISLQQKRLGFLLNHALFLKNFTAYKKLKMKYQKIKKKIEDLEGKKRIDPPKDARVGAQTPGGHDTDQQSSTDDNNVVDFVPENTRNVPVRPSNGILRNKSSPPRSDVSRTVKFEPRESLKKLHSEISFNRKLHSKFSSSYSYKAEELGLVGFDTHIKDLIDQLTKEDHQIIPLMGEKGSGKTTLARAIRATKKVKDYFQPPVAWITIDEVSTAKDIVLNLLKQVGSSKDQDLTYPDFDLDLLINRLNERLNGKRFLIVLDDLQETDTWGEIKTAFPDNKNGTKIIVTTRDKAVAGSANREYSLDLDLPINRLNEEDTLYLFQQKSGSACPENLKPKIVEICDGFPLNVVLLGSLLSTKDSDKWQSKLDNGDWQKSGPLASSYNDTSDEEKLCLLYMVLFPKEYDVPVRRLLRLWLAEGFIKRPDPEGRVEKCFERLVQRSLILMTNQRSDGGHRRCQLLGALHEYLFPKAIDIKLFHIHRMACHTDEASVGTRRLVDFVDSKFASKSKLKSWRSYLSFNFQKNDIPAREVGVLLSNMLKSGFSLLRVLDLEGVYKPTLPDNLGNFYQLRYLGLRWTFLDHLPASVGDLTYLETLDLKHTNVNSLPSSVWKLNHLRHLNLNDIRLDMPVTSKHSLPGLITLCGLSIVERECPVKDGLDRLTHLRELDLTFQLKNCGELLDWVSASTSLEQLRLRSKNDKGQASTLSLKPLGRLEKLSHMNFLGKLPILLTHNQFPPNLKVLTLSVSELKTDLMETLGQLKHLTVLRLLANSYLGTKISCPPNGFMELRVLKLWMLSNLMDWELGENCMEKLNELSIRCCTKLKSVPPRLLRQDSFKELILNNMPPEFKNGAEKEKKPHVSVIEKNYTFMPLPVEKKPHVSVIEKNYTFMPLPYEVVPEWDATMRIKAYEEEQQRLEVGIQVKKDMVSELQDKIQALKAPIPPDVNDRAITPIVVDQIEANPEREVAAMVIKAYEEEKQRLEVEIQVKKVRVSELQAKIEALKAKIQALKGPIPPDVNDHATTSIVVPTEPTPDAAETSKSPM